MEALIYLLAALFLPLFPASMVFNRVYACLSRPWMRIALLLVWPQLGVLLLIAVNQSAPPWLSYWAVLTAVLYAFRALALRDLGLWTAHIATSAWALLWVVAQHNDSVGGLLLQAVGLSIPLMMLAWIGGRLEQLFGAAYAGVTSGLAQSLPRLSGVTVAVVLAVVATPLFPGFFTLLAATTQSLPLLPLAAVAVLLVWMLWAWAGARMTRGLVVGEADVAVGPDLSTPVLLVLATLLIALLVVGIATAEMVL